jgi:Uncharacterized protein conserved in bacteria
MDIDALREKLQQPNLPPVELWQPELSGEMDLVIKQNGQWFHDGSLIKRASLCRLFASILRYESNEYFLVTPHEKWQIQVECLPFLIVEADRDVSEKHNTIILTDSLGYQIEINANHPLKMMSLPNVGNDLPSVVVRRNLLGLISRNVYYQMVDWALEDQLATNLSHELSIYSSGQAFSLGNMQED